MSIPSLFLSHGAPDLPLRSGATQTFLQQLFQMIPRPKSILAISAHWLTAHPTVSKAAQPKTIYDFGGFPAELYQLTYPAPGNPKLAEQVMTMLTSAGFQAQSHATRGFDHGTWTPMMLINPDGDIPIAQLSIQPRQTPDYHFRIGQALAPLRDQGILIMASGAATHNLGAFGATYDAPPPDWAVVFDNWLAEAIQHNDLERLLNYRQLAPYAVQNHPTEEHLLPLFVALGAGNAGGETLPGQQLHHGFTYGAFSMAAYAFG